VRNQLLINGFGKALSLNDIDCGVKQNSSASPADVRNETLQVIRSEGLVRLGSMSNEGGPIAAWNRPLDRSMRKSSHYYVRHYDDPEKWMFSAWLQLTDKGEQLARSLEATAIDSYR
jgi:hypothetical protein